MLSPQPLPIPSIDNETRLSEEHIQKQKSTSEKPPSPLSLHPAWLSPGLEYVWSSDQGKEVVPPELANQYRYIQHKTTAASYCEVGSSGGNRKRLSILGLPTVHFVLLLATVALVILGFGLGLGLGLRNRSKSSSPATPQAEYSTRGAFNGSGLALASYSFGTGGYGIINVYFQHWAGEIRKMQLMNDGTWQGGDVTNVVAADARNATPISAVAYAMDSKATWHIFYVDKKNIIREKISDNTTNQWRDGPVGKLNLRAMSDPLPGLQACWYGNFYGTANYTHSPIPGTGSNTTSQDAVIGMHLWYGRDPVTVEEVTWTYNTTDWYRQDNITASGRSGIGCYSWGPGSVSYAMMVNLDDEVQVMWKDLNKSVLTTPSHPVNQWVNTSFVIPNVMPGTSLGYTNYLYTQLQDDNIAGYNVSFAAEKTSIIDSQNFEIPRKPLPDTHFSVTAIPNASGGSSLLIFDQLNGNDVTANTRDLSNGQWAYNELPVPDT